MSGYRIVETSKYGQVGSDSPRFGSLDGAKRAAILRNRTHRPDPSVWWVVADAAGTPLDPQP